MKRTPLGRSPDNCRAGPGSGLPFGSLAPPTSEGVGFHRPFVAQSRTCGVGLTRRPVGRFTLSEALFTSI